MSSDSTFSVHLGECAEAAHEFNKARRCIMDVQSILLEASDHLRQLRMVQRSLGLHPVTPSPPIVSQVAAPCPLHRAHMKDDEAIRPANIDLPVVYSDSMSGVPLSPQESGTTVEYTPRSSPSTRTFTPVSTMQRLAHPVATGLPVSVVAANALNFVAAWRREDSNSAWQEEVVHDCLQVRYDTEREEEGSRHRLRNLLLTVSEQMDRFAIMGEYDKFFVFCVEREPVWRQAARQLQKENDARFNSTGNIYARFVMEETALSDKMKMYQEAADYVVSQRYAEWELRRAAQVTAVARRRRQSASHVVPVVPEHHQRTISDPIAAPTTSPPERVAATGHAIPPCVPHRPPNSPERPSGRNKDRATPTPSKTVEPLSSVEVDPYRERWRAIVGYLSGGERCRSATSTRAAAEQKRPLTPAPVPPPAARAEAHHATRPPAVRDGRFSGTSGSSSTNSSAAHHAVPQYSSPSGGRHAGGNPIALPSPKQEIKKKEMRSADGSSPPSLSKRAAKKAKKKSAAARHA